ERIRPADPCVCHAPGAHEDHCVRTAPPCTGHPHVPRSDLGHERAAVDVRRLRPQLGQAIHLRRRRRAAPAEGHDPAPDWLPRYDAGEQESRGSAELGRRRPSLGLEHVHRSRLLGVAHRGSVPGGNGASPHVDEEPERLRHRLPAVLGAAGLQGACTHDAGAGRKSAVNHRGFEWLARAIVVGSVAIGLSVGAANAQTRFTYSSGQPLEPAYEGWMQNPDGSYTLYFGYMNTNWQQDFDIPVGPENHFEPGDADRGQPTHFYPRRNPFLFTFQVPKDFGKQELIWTITANGVTRKAYASLKSDYEIDKQVISTEIGGDNGSLADALRDNIPPDLKVDGPKTRTVKIGQPLALAVVAGDPD